MTLSILAVCTGNICRSPLAEQVLASDLSLIEETRVESAGTSALVGANAPEPAVRLAREADVDLTGHVGRQMTAAMLRETDLVLTMTRDHRRIVVETAPASMRRAFTLREFARLADALHSQLRETVIVAGATTAEEGMRAAIALASSMRGTLPPPDAPEDLDVIDPYRRSDDVYRESFAQLVPSARRVSEYLADAARYSTSSSPR